MTNRLAKCLFAVLVALGIASPTVRAEQISVTHWGVLMYGVPYAIAMDKGLFKQNGIDIDGLLTSKGGGTTVRNVLAGGLPYGEVSLAAAVVAAKQGLDIRIVNAGAATVGDILYVTMPNSTITSIKDLVGKRIAFTSPKSVTDMVSIMSLQKAGVKVDSVERIPTGGIGGGLTALEQGGVVAAPIMDPVWAANTSKYKPLFYAKDMLPQMTQTVGITTAEFAQKEPAKLKAIIAGRRAGVDRLYAEPDEASEIFAKAYAMDKAVAAQSIKNMIGIRFWSTGAIDRKALDAMVEGLRITGEVDGPVDWSKLVDTRFLPTDLQTGS